MTLGLPMLGRGCRLFLPVSLFNQLYLLTAHIHDDVLHSTYLFRMYVITRSYQVNYWEEAEWIFFMTPRTRYNTRTAQASTSTYYGIYPWRGNLCPIGNVVRVPIQHMRTYVGSRYVPYTRRMHTRAMARNVVRCMHELGHHPAGTHTLITGRCSYIIHMLPCHQSLDLEPILLLNKLPWT